VEAEFDIHDLDLKNFFEENDLDVEEVLLLREKSLRWVNRAPSSTTRR